MSLRRARQRFALGIESLEVREAPSGLAGSLSAAEALHHHGTRAEHAARTVQVASARHGQGQHDGATHDANDARRGRGRDNTATPTATPARQGTDDPANHDAKDNRGRGGDGQGHR